MGYPETGMMGKAGTTHVVVMARAWDETVKFIIYAGHYFGVKLMDYTLRMRKHGYVC